MFTKIGKNIEKHFLTRAFYAVSFAVIIAIILQIIHSHSSQSEEKIFPSIFLVISFALFLGVIALCYCKFQHHLKDIALNKEAYSTVDKSYAIITLSPDAIVQDANVNLLEISGYSLADVKGHHHSIFMEDSYAKTGEYQQLWEDLSQGKSCEGEYKMLGKNGKEIWVYAIYSPVFDEDNKLSSILQFVRDISEQVKIKKEFEMMSLVAEKSTSSIVITDANERIEYVNAGFTKSTGYSLEESIGKNPRFLQGKNTNKETKARIRRSIEKQEPFDDEILNYSKNGVPYWISISITPVFDKDGNLSRFISIQNRWHQYGDED